MGRSSASRKHPSRANGAGKSNVGRAMCATERAAFMARLSRSARVSTLREELLDADRTDLCGLALEAIAVAEQRGDEESLAELATVVRRVLDRAHLPLETEHGTAAPSRVLRFPEAAGLLAAALAAYDPGSLAAVGPRETEGALAPIGANAKLVLERHPEHWPAKPGALRAMWKALIDAATNRRTRALLLRAVVEGWTGDAELAKRTVRAAKNKK